MSSHHSAASHDLSWRENDNEGPCAVEDPDSQTSGLGMWNRGVRPKRLGVACGASIEEIVVNVFKASFTVVSHPS